MKKLVAVICSISIIIAISLILGCGGGGGGGSANNGNDLFKVINTVNKNISADSATQIGVLTSDGIQLNLSKGALSDNSNVAVRQYSNDAAMARFTENFPSLASFTVVSSLYELTAKDNKSKTLTVLEIPSEVEVALTEDLNTNKLYYAVVKQNGEWTLLPLQNNSSSNSSRLASNASRSIKMIFNTIYESLFIVAVTKKNATNSKLTYAEDFIISLNGSETSPQTITASYTQKFDNDIEASLRLTLKGDVSPDKAEISITALQNENKKISIKKSDKTYKDFDFTTAEQRGKYQTTFKLTSDLATSKLSGNTATYNFIIKAKDMNVSDMPTKLVFKASVKGSSLFYSNDMQINFEKGADQPVIPEEPSTPDNPTKPEEPSTPEEPQIIVYTIKYDLDGGKLVKSNPQKYNTKSDTITLNNPIKEGYTFVGWTGSNGNSPEKTVTIKTGSTGNKEFIANWNKNPADTFTVALIRGTGIATVKGEGAYKSGTKVTVSFTLEDGYEFEKWSGDKTEASFSMPAKDVTMTANAKPITYNITYNLDGGSVSKANPFTYNVTTVDIILNNPTKEGYTFVGWSGTGLTGNSNTKVTIAKGSTDNKEFIANWTINSYKLVLNKGTGIETVTGAKTYRPGENVTASCTMLAGYEFVNWTGDKTADTFTMPAKDVTMTANAKPITYTITYNLDGGTIKATNPTKYDVSSSTITLINPIKENYDFIGWTGDGIEEGTTSRIVTIPHGSIGNRNYVASWAISIYRFNLTGDVALELRRCPAGTFVMGCMKNYASYHEGPNHNVTITKDFYIGTYEVTQTQYQIVMGNNPSVYKEDGANKPVDSVNWYNAMTFCENLNILFSSQLPTGYHFDLPTEAQWEYACRAGTTTDYNNGTNMISSTGHDTNLELVGWYCPDFGDENTKPHTVGLLASNSFGLYDMHGNVWEWCKDSYFVNFYTTCNNEENCKDPLYYEGTNSFHVIRGGSWGMGQNYCRSSCRDSSGPSNENETIGFRVALVKD